MGGRAAGPPPSTPSTTRGCSGRSRKPASRAANLCLAWDFTVASERNLSERMLHIRGEANGYAAHMTTDPLPNTPEHKVLMHMAFGDHQVTNWATLVEARTIGAGVRTRARPGPRRHRRHVLGIPDISSYPYDGSAIVVWDVGPVRTVNGRTKGTTPPPIENIANREGIDPHGPDASETVDGQFQIGMFLTPNGTINAVCGFTPCYLDGWTGHGG